VSAKAVFGTVVVGLVVAVFAPWMYLLLAGAVFAAWAFGGSAASARAEDEARALADVARHAKFHAETVARVRRHEARRTALARPRQGDQAHQAKASPRAPQGSARA
jgi:hypothetical protein